MKVFRQFLDGVLRSSHARSCIAPVRYPRSGPVGPGLRYIPGHSPKIVYLGDVPSVEDHVRCPRMRV